MGGKPKTYLSKLCKLCGREFFPKESDAPYEFRNRKTCSVKCGHRLMAQGNIKYDIEEKVCEICGNSFSRKEMSRSRASLQKQRTCGMICGQALAKKSRTVIPTPAQKICEICSSEFVIRSKESPYHFRKRHTCSKKCSALMRAAKRSLPTPEEKFCENCGGSFRRLPTDRLATFRKRKTCNRSCGHALSSKGRIKHTVTVQGVDMTLKELADIAECDPATILERINSGRYPLTGKKK